MENLKKYGNVIGMGLIIGIPAILYFTGLHTEVIGRVQSLILWTGLFKADTTKNEDEKKIYLTDYDFPLVDLKGNEKSFKEFKGKVVFMNFWATWCPPCLAELPNINKLYDKVKSESEIEFAIISVDRDVAKVPDFINRREFTFPVYLLKDKLPAILESSSIPVTYILAPDGEIVFRRDSMANYDTPFFLEFITGLKKAK